MVDRSSLVFGLLCGVAAIAFLLMAGCSASVRVDGIGLKGVLDPGKLLDGAWKTSPNRR